MLVELNLPTLPGMAEAQGTKSGRIDDRRPDQIRPIRFQNGIAPYATGSTLVEWGNTRVLCGVTVEETVPRWMKEQNVSGGWITAEYSMLPYSTLQRKQRDIAKGKIDGRSQEIQRLIGRAMRAAINLEKIGPRTIWVDCDVLQADGGTRTAAITGAWVALHDCLNWMKARDMIRDGVLRDHVAAVSCGLYQGTPVLDLDYAEDSNADADANFVMTGAGGIVEVQGTAETVPFSQEGFDELMALAKKGIAELISLQKLTVA